jgi:hypothetical protein
VGQALDLGTERYTVVGVAPEGFTGTSFSDVEVWIPIAAAGALRFERPGLVHDPQLAMAERNRAAHSGCAWSTPSNR